MPLALQSPTEPGPSSPLQTAAAALCSALSGMASETRDMAWQDGLDLLATIAGLKPLCLVGRGFAHPAWTAALRRVAAEAALPVLEAAPWLPQAEPGFLPDWYVLAAARRNAMPVTYLCRDEATRQRAAGLSSRGRVSAAEEAQLLGYPVCCVEQHHRRALAFERLVIEMIERLAQGDRGRRTRLVEAGVEPLPATQAEWRRYEYLTTVHPSPSTSVNQCDACAGDDTSAAVALSRQYEMLAAAAGFSART